MERDIGITDKGQEVLLCEVAPKDVFSLRASAGDLYDHNYIFPREEVVQAAASTHKTSAFRCLASSAKLKISAPLGLV